MSRKIKGSSKRWLQEHFSDAYVKRAQAEGYRARSVYKLMDISKRYQLLKPKMLVVDLGAAPGGWSELAKQLVGPVGRVVALDILPIKPIAGVEFMQGDFSDPKMAEILLEKIGRQMADVVLSDMAPNLSGLVDVDQERATNLVMAAFNFAVLALKPNGNFLTKVFQGANFTSIQKLLATRFREVKVIKPEASRARSSEVYILGRGFEVGAAPGE
jgi:23S rRNA (uridine2552-2'-O)-methyltransferase